MSLTFSFLQCKWKSFLVFCFSANDYPDIEIVAGAGGLSGDTSGAMRQMVGITDEFYETVFRDIIGEPAFGLVPVLLRLVFFLLYSLLRFGDDYN